jgi:hypothetical protein
MVGITISEINRGFAPDVSVRNTRPTIADDAAAVACADVNVIESHLDPLVPAVNNVTRVPDPSLAVFAAAIVAVTVLGVSVNIGDVLAAIIVNYSMSKFLKPHL